MLFMLRTNSFPEASETGSDIAYWTSKLVVISACIKLSGSHKPSWLITKHMGCGAKEEADS